MDNYSSNGGSATVFLVLGGVFAFAILLCWIAACCGTERRKDTPAPAAVNGGSEDRDGNLTIDVTEAAVAVMEIAAEGRGGANVGCCCGGGDGDGDGGGCGGCGGD